MARRSLDEDGEIRFKLALELTHGKMSQVPFAVMMVLTGYRNVTRVAVQARYNYLADAIRWKLIGALTHRQKSS